MGSNFLGPDSRTPPTYLTPGPGFTARNPLGIDDADAARSAYRGGRREVDW